MRIGMIAVMVIGVIVFNGCAKIDFDYIPHKELNGKILVDPSNGKRYKLEWQEGWGESWRFLVPIRIGKDTAIKWIYYPSNK